MGLTSRWRSKVGDSPLRSSPTCSCWAHTPSSFSSALAVSEDAGPACNQAFAIFIGTYQGSQTPDAKTMIV